MITQHQNVTYTLKNITVIPFSKYYKQNFLIWNYFGNFQLI